MRCLHLDHNSISNICLRPGLRLAPENLDKLSLYWAWRSRISNVDSYSDIGVNIYQVIFNLMEIYSRMSQNCGIASSGVKKTDQVMPTIQSTRLQYSIHLLLSAKCSYCHWSPMEGNTSKLLLSNWRKWDFDSFLADRSYRTSTRASSLQLRETTSSTEWNLIDFFQ